MKKASGRADVVLRDPDRIELLASPVRQEIVDTVQALRRASVAELAAELDRPADGLYYHLRKLLRAGLLVESGHRGRGREREAVYALPEPEAGLRLGYDPDDPENVEAVLSVITSMLRVTGRDVEAGFRPDLAVCEGPRRNLWAARMRGWLDPEELEEVNRLLNRLRELMDRPRRSPEQRLHSLTFAVAPAVPPRGGGGTTGVSGSSRPGG